MRVGILGRTRSLINSINTLQSRGYKISFIWTSKSEEYYSCNESEFKNKAKDLDCIFINSYSIKKNFKLIKKTNTDVVISMNFNNLISKEFLNFFKFGILNAHYGDLPKYKGNACPNWAILNNEKKIGLSIHKMSENLDSGPIYKKDFLRINKETYINDIYSWGESKIPSMFLESLDLIKKGVKPKPQSRKFKTLRCFPRKPEDSKIDWFDNALKINKLVRASSNPLHGAYCFTEKRKKLVIWKCLVKKVNYDFNAIPGQIIEISDNYFLVACGEQTVLLINDFNLIDNKNKKIGKKMSMSLICKNLRVRLT